MDWETLIPKCIDHTLYNGVPTNTVTLRCLPAIFQNVIYALLLFAGIGAMIFIMWGGLKFIVSWGDPKQIDEGKKAIMYAIVGLILVLLAAAIVNILAGFTGANCIKLFGFENC